MTVQYSLVGDARGKTLTVVFSDGNLTTVPSSHANFKSVLEYLTSTEVEDIDEKHVRENLNLILKAGTMLTELSERVSVVGNQILFDGDVLEGTISEHILRLIENKDEKGWTALVNFLEKVSTNPSKASQESLYSWLTDREFTIHEDGDFIAYKGVKVDKDGVSLSIHSGEAFVDGVVVQGHIPNREGSVISMPRGDVDPNVGVGCSTGLHAGNWRYASMFASGRVLTVKINPRDVVSVPEDSNHEKLRVSRYRVISSTDVEYSGPTWESDGDFEPVDYTDSWDQDEDDEDVSEEERWEDEWAHDKDGSIRERFDVEVGETPEDVIAWLSGEMYWTEDEARATVFAETSSEDSAEEDADEPEDVPVPPTDTYDDEEDEAPTTSRWFTLP